MIKQIILVSFLLAATSINAQTEKNLGDFNKLKVYDRIEVELIKSDDNKVVITGNNTEDVVFVNKNGNLKIKMSLKKVFDGDLTTVQLYYKTIDVIDVNEGAFVSSNDVIKQFEIDTRAQEGGSIKLMVEDVTFVEAKAITGGVIRISGQAKNQNIDLTTGGSYLGKDLETDKTKVNIRAAGEAHVKAIQEVDVTVKAGGTAYIYGTPTTIKENIVLGGKVVRKD
ncbi:head GIN domain-containing protein [Xanthomarina sp.]|uniref:head GIN domain-containing protein n=1 Tax=Xanthomarina sp. TaxID=1931211 RepID=UPI002BBDA530|nr:head GIN domain-containing protein [Xanthomarina sp.]HLV38794.1 head GIN domain-containing protein [Xanthomarina sp.]